MIPIAKPTLAYAEEEAVTRVLRSGWLSTGAETARFESRLAEFVGVEHAVAVNSCTNAILLALMALGVTIGDEVLVPAFTCVADLHPIRILGAVPVLVDIEDRTFAMDPDQIAAAVTSRTVGIVFAHLFGLPGPALDVREEADRHGLWMIEDIALGLGATSGGQPVGAVGTCSVLSFHPRKMITTGEGGMVLSSSPDLAEEIAALARYGASTAAWDRHHGRLFNLPSYPRAGLNCKMTDVQAAIGNVQVDRLPHLIDLRREIASHYDEAFSDLDWIAPVQPLLGTEASYQSYVLRARDREVRDALLEHLYGVDVAAVMGAEAMNDVPLYGNRGATFPVAADAADRTICIPIYPNLSERDEMKVMVAVTSLPLTAREPASHV